MSDFDEGAYQRARALADERFPMPKYSPTFAAVTYEMSAFLAVLSIEIFLPLGLMWSGAITVILGSLIGWADSRNRIRANSREFRDAYEIFRAK